MLSSHLIYPLSEDSLFRPYFEKTSHDVTVQQDDVAFFECHIFNLHNQTVSVVTRNAVTMARSPGSGGLTDIPSILEMKDS